MDARTETDLLGLPVDPLRNGAARRPAAQHLSMVAAVLDLVRPPGASLTILELASEDGGLASLATPDRIVDATLANGNGNANGNGSRAANGNGHENGDGAAASFDCAVAIDIVHRLGLRERRAQLARLRHAARGLVLVEAPRLDGPENPLAEAIELFREYGDSVLVLAEEHLPAVLSMRELRRGSESGGRSGDGPEAISRGLLSPSPRPARSILISVVDPAAPGIDVEALQWCCSPPGTRERDPASLAVLPLSLEVRRLSDRLEVERADADRARSEADDMRRKLAELTRVASEDRRARESAECQVEIIAAARGYRIGLAAYKVRAAIRRRIAAAWRRLTAPGRAIVRRLRGGEAPAVDR